MFRKIVNLTQSQIQDQTAATAIEYSLLAAMFAVLVVAAYTQFGLELNATFQLITDAFDSIFRPEQPS